MQVYVKTATAAAGFAGLQVPARAAGEQTCQELAEHWPNTIREIEAIMRLRDVGQFERATESMHRYLSGLNLQACPQWADAVGMQCALIEEYTHIYKMTHDADKAEADLHQQFGGQSVARLRAEYIAMHDKACIDASRVSSLAWRIFQSQPRTQPAALRAQQYVINIETDAALVGADGTTGSAASNAAAFVALVETPVHDAVQGQLRTLQGQGPQTPQAVEKYVQHSLAYARQKKLGHVVFVNAAGGQIPNFSAGLPQGAATGPSTSYVEFTGWADGSLVTPKLAAQYVASLMPHFEDPHNATLMVVNCNAGLDRSGTLNVLVQLALQARDAQAQHLDKEQIRKQGLIQIPGIVARIKTARPHSISMFGRYIFIYQSFEAYMDMLMP